MELIISVSLAVISAAALTLCSLKPLQIFQLSSYKTTGFWGWLKRTKFDYQIRCFALAFFSFAAAFICVMCFPASAAQYTGAAFYLGLCAYFFFLQRKEKQKTPIKFTPRIIRQIVILSILYAAISFAAVYFTVYTPKNGRQNHISYALAGVLPILIPLVVTAAHYVAAPIEKLVALKYIRRAKRALNTNKIIKIGITGSYGKTTAKNILHELLAKRYKVLTSPESHNTPMGLCKLINGGIAGYDVLIAEMGARHRGDIKELCELIDPDYGIVTSAGNQHLETFGTVENIINAKLDLARHAPVCVINSDDVNLTQGIANDKTLSAKNGLLYAGESAENAAYSDVEITAPGTRFNLKLNGKMAQITTALLGRHIPALFTECAVLADKLGVSIEEIAGAAANIKPVPHRLQLIKTPSATIIDDAYNSNPQGAKNALEVLAAFDCAKVVITPGFVELGELQAQKNRELGQAVAACADYLITVKNPDIVAGALEAGMDKEKILSAQSLSDATALFTALDLKAPAVLFLNDLPDNY